MLVSMSPPCIQTEGGVSSWHSRWSSRHGTWRSEAACENTLSPAIEYAKRPRWLAVRMVCSGQEGGAEGLGGDSVLPADVAIAVEEGQDPALRRDGDEAAVEQQEFAHGAAESEREAAVSVGVQRGHSAVPGADEERAVIM